MYRASSDALLTPRHARDPPSGCVVEAGSSPPTPDPSGVAPPFARGGSGRWPFPAPPCEGGGGGCSSEALARAIRARTVLFGVGLPTLWVGPPTFGRGLRPRRAWPPSCKDTAVKRSLPDNARFSSRRPGVTLVEMLVTLAVLLLMMTVIVQIFQAATGALNVGAGVPGAGQPAPPARHDDPLRPERRHRQA